MKKKLIAIFVFTVSPSMSFADYSSYVVHQATSSILIAITKGDVSEYSTPIYHVDQVRDSLIPNVNFEYLEVVNHLPVLKASSTITAIDTKKELDFDMNLISMYQTQITNWQATKETSNNASVNAWLDTQIAETQSKISSILEKYP